MNNPISSPQGSENVTDAIQREQQRLDECIRVEGLTDTVRLGLQSFYYHSRVWPFAVPLHEVVDDRGLVILNPKAPITDADDPFDPEDATPVSGEYVMSDFEGK
jgi:hypothetical protein